jgi:hypothetical protein
MHSLTLSLPPAIHIGMQHHVKLLLRDGVGLQGLWRNDGAVDLIVDAMADSNVGFDPEAPGRRFHAILLDIDHTPRHVLHPSHSAFYTPAGLGKLVGHLHPGGVFALWSDDPPDLDFEAVLAEVFDRSEASVVRFPNPLTGGYSTNTVYVAS